MRAAWPSGQSVEQAWKSALACDPVSAFGGVLISNGPIDAAAAEDINKIFFEVILAPAYSPEALDILFTKKNRIVLELKDIVRPQQQFRSILNGVAVQDRDLKVGGQDSEITAVTRRKVTDREIGDLIFANKIVKNSKSNAIVIAKDSQRLPAASARLRVWMPCVRQSTRPRVSDSTCTGRFWLPTPSSRSPTAWRLPHGEGIDCIIQPGGSVRDADSIEYCDKNGMAMIFTGLRHFKN